MTSTGKLPLPPKLAAMLRKMIDAHGAEEVGKALRQTAAATELKRIPERRSFSEKLISAATTKEKLAGSFQKGSIERAEGMVAEAQSEFDRRAKGWLYGEMPAENTRFGKDERQKSFTVPDEEAYNWLAGVVKNHYEKIRTIDVLALSGGTAKNLLRCSLQYNIKTRLLLQDPRIQHDNAIVRGSLGLGLRTLELLWNMHSELRLREMGTSAELEVFTYAPGKYQERRAVVINVNEHGTHAPLIVYGQYFLEPLRIDGMHPAHFSESSYVPNGSVSKLTICSDKDPSFKQTITDRLKPLYQSNGSVDCSVNGTLVLQLTNRNGVPAFAWHDGFEAFLIQVRDQIRAWNKFNTIMESKLANPVQMHHGA